MINNFEDVLEFTNAKNFIDPKLYVPGFIYTFKEVKYLEDESLTFSTGYKEYNYSVMGKNGMKNFVTICLKDKFIKKLECDCYRYYKFNTCEHLVAILNLDYNRLFNGNMLDNNKYITKTILNKYNALYQKRTNIKKEAYIKLEISDDYYKTIKLSIGIDKMYNLSNHFNNFYNVYKNGEGSVKFGTSFTYIPDDYYFSNDSKKLINAYYQVNGYKYMNKDDLKRFLYEIKDIPFIYGDYQIDKIYDEFPVETNLSRNDDNYKLSFDLSDLETVFRDDFEYVMYKGKMYHINKEMQDLLIMLDNYQMMELELDNTDIDSFTNGLLNDLKNNITIADDIDNIIIPSDIVSELYFDLRNNYIICDLIFIYDNNKINYFDNKTNILRNIDFESNVLNDLILHGFIIKNNKLILDDIYKEVDFIESGLDELSSKYLVYTTEKYKSINIRKKTNVTSTFTIGQDNILNYNFDLNGIDPNELVNIFKNIKENKKYYRLKSGDILSLENKDLSLLEELSEELELSDEEIINGKGSIMKYRAIYLDSLKTNNSVIKTDGLFNNFIDEFYKYKDQELTLKDTNILRDYQRVGVKWLYNLDKCGFGGILADEMGLGKTIQIIYYIKQILEEDNNAKFLIVVPTSLAYNWEHEFNTFGNEIKKIICVGNKDKRTKILDNLNNINVVITTYGVLREDIDLYKNIKFRTIIIDEAQNIKNYMAGITKAVKQICADTKFALTGTPIENSILELWSIFDFIMPGYLASLNRFNKKYKIKDYNEDSDIIIKNLSNQINPFILRRKKENVLDDLPEKLVNDIYIDLSQKQKELYALEANKVKEELNTVIKSEGIGKARFLMLQLLTKLREICIDPSIVYEDIKEESNKIETLSNIIDNYIENGHKLLIFSSFRKGLNIVEEKLKNKKISYYVIDGSTKASKRIEMVDDFNTNDNIKVFLIMLKAGGTGLNLVGADTVVHLDLWWNPQAENQATDRAHRIGQTHNVEVIHLITKGTIEEKIKELQDKKKILSDKIIDGDARDQNILSELTKEDIVNLLSYENKEDL